jgi:hypothetical protein
MADPMVPRSTGGGPITNRQPTGTLGAPTPTDRLNNSYLKLTVPVPIPVSN